MKDLPSMPSTLRLRVQEANKRPAHLDTQLISMIFAVIVLTACEAQVGDPCVSSTQCAPGQLCDVNSAEGYCTQRDCEEGSCPEGSICVTFESLDRYCMATCEGTDDCRDGYLCDEDIAASPICRQAP